jgi:hypothetical protein
MRGCGCVCVVFGGKAVSVPLGDKKGTRQLVGGYMIRSSGEEREGA